ncbi:hypothetical protein NHX12_025865 [Muraenolepis orangiensis]|uniref:Metalloendopeptidase n=1 Tax=Muraenolepis orangiensis TaxID=630683 RepID=A0A9Q0EGG7_9TELE|nr:hypothetical protein NHX12_025865 [Muraenolepis orangiensis]
MDVPTTTLCLVLFLLAVSQAHPLLAHPLLAHPLLAHPLLAHPLLAHPLLVRDGTCWVCLRLTPAGKRWYLLAVSQAHPLLAHPLLNNQENQADGNGEFNQNNQENQADGNGEFNQNNQENQADGNGEFNQNNQENQADGNGEFNQNNQENQADGNGEFNQNNQENQADGNGEFNQNNQENQADGNETMDIGDTILKMNMGSTDFLMEGDMLIPRQRTAMKCYSNAFSCLWSKSDDGKVRIPFLINEKYTPIRKQGCVQHGIIQHEVLHALGFYHEHTRSDRDQHILIHKDNIKNHYMSNFRKMDTNNLGTPYDYTSVMHYGSTAFSTVYRQKTMTPIPDASVPIGQRDGLSQIDILRINRLYKCSSQCN